MTFDTDDSEDDGLDDLEATARPVANNAADAKAIRRRRIVKKIEEKDVARFWRTVLADPIGRAQIWAHLTDAHTFEERFACGPNGFPQPDATWFHAGEQAFGLRFYQKLLALDPAAVRLMHIEHDPRFSSYRDDI